MQGPLPGRVRAAQQRLKDGSFVLLRVCCVRARVSFRVGGLARSLAAKKTAAAAANWRRALAACRGFFFCVAPLIACVK